MLFRSNLEMAVTEEMKRIALDARPDDICLVPEKRQEITTEGGLDVLGQQELIMPFVDAFGSVGIRVSLFIDPVPEQIEASRAVGASVIELHTGAYAEANTEASVAQEIQRIEAAVALGESCGLRVNAGHGLNYQNVQRIAVMAGIRELNIGHAIVARAVFDGFPVAVSEMKRLMTAARSD